MAVSFKRLSLSLSRKSTKSDTGQPMSQHNTDSGSAHSSGNGVLPPSPERKASGSLLCSSISRKSSSNSLVRGLLACVTPTVLSGDLDDLDSIANDSTTHSRASSAAVSRASSRNGIFSRSPSKHSLSRAASKGSLAGVSLPPLVRPEGSAHSASSASGRAR